MREKIALFWRRLTHMGRQRQFDIDLQMELDFHLAMKQQEAEFAGMSPEQARYAAQRQMGNVSQASEQSREAWTLGLVEQWSKDGLHALRVLWKDPWFFGAAVMTLGLGVGANTSVFTLMDALLLRGLPVPEPNRMVQIVFQSARSTNMSTMSYPIFEDLRDHVGSFSSLFTWHSTDLSMGWGVDAQPLTAAVVSGRAYETLGISAQVGRLILSSDDQAGASAVAVLSNDFWARNFNRDPHVIGRRLLLNQHPFTVIGVLPASFLGVMAGTNPDVTITIHADELVVGQRVLLAKRLSFLLIFGRLKPGVTQEEARAELAVLSPALLKTQLPADAEFWSNGEKFSPTRLSLVSATGSSSTAQNWRRPLWILSGISGLLLLLACVNLASLSLSRTASRHKEFAMRLALGAGRDRIVRQVVTESLILSICGTLLGTWIAMAFTRALLVLLSTESSPLVLDLRPDWRHFCFAGSLALLTGLVVSVGPILGLDFQPHEALKKTNTGPDHQGHKSRFAAALVTIQIGLAVVLGINAMLLVRTLEKLKAQNVGFDEANLVFVSVDASKAAVNQTQLAQLYTELLEGMRKNPHIRSVGLTNITPLGGSFGWITLGQEHWPSRAAQDRMLYTYNVTPGYLRTLGLRLREGRDFRANDSRDAIPVGILSSSAAHSLFPGQNAIGQLLRVDKTTVYRIIGEVNDAKYTSLREKAPITLYTKMSPFPSCELAVRSELDRSEIVRQVKQVVKSTGRDIQLRGSIAMNEQIDRALASERLIATLASLFALLAAALIAIGILGTIGYQVERRTKEMGVRLALGSPVHDVVWLVLRQALIRSVLGLAVGVPAAMLTAQFARSFLYEVTAFDPLTILTITALILLVTTAAALRPAVVASRVDPLLALRCE